MNEWLVKDITVTRTHQGVVAICGALRDLSRKVQKPLRLSQQNLDIRVGIMSHVKQMPNLCTTISNFAKTISETGKLSQIVSTR